ncbi:hypothetical protein ARMGADRAFT_1033681 [Armillaria gallica]|uniref:Uncharacterized protein n=1 Tax=Armillaria gallica TaxID=47427 RepID=A0A2H3D4V5_ARMGA|nr:hypothetical protein ARMGADRAFT_1033681 [Armillaria gallica]
MALMEQLGDQLCKPTKGRKGQHQPAIMWWLKQIHQKWKWMPVSHNVKLYEVVESPDEAVLEAEFLSVEVMEAMESVKGVTVDICNELINEIGPVELDSGNMVGGGINGSVSSMLLMTVDGDDVSGKGVKNTVKRLSSLELELISEVLPIIS